MMDLLLHVPIYVLSTVSVEYLLIAAHLAMAGYIRARDPGRPVHYEGGGSRTAATDILCPMYARIPQVH